VTLAELRHALELLPDGASVTLPRADLLEALGTNGTTPPAPDPEPGGEWLTARDVADLLRTSVRWVYDHAVQLGGKRLSRRCLRFPRAAVRRYMERRR